MDQQGQPQHPVVFMRCTRGSDQRTAGMSCDSKRAYKMSHDGSGAPMFKCVTCSFVWVVPLGGGFNL